MKCVKWNSEKWNDNSSYCLINIRRMEVSLEIFKVSGLSDLTSEMVSSSSSWSVWQRWNHVDKLHHSPALEQVLPNLFPLCHLHKASAWLHWCGGWGLQIWATTEIYIVNWCSEYSAVPHLDWFMMPGVVNFQYKRQSEVRVFLWVFVANIWMHTDKAVRLGMKNDLDSLCHQELMIFGLSFFSLWLSRVKLSPGRVNLYYV